MDADIEMGSLVYRWNDYEFPHILDLIKFARGLFRKYRVGRIFLREVGNKSDGSVRFVLVANCSLDSDSMVYSIRVSAKIGSDQVRFWSRSKILDRINRSLNRR